MKYSALQYLICFLLFPLTVLAQEKDLQKASISFEEHSYIEARELLNKLATELGSDTTEVLGKLGDTYYFNADYKNASKWYDSLYRKDSKMKPEHLFRYSMALKSNGNQVGSDEMMAKFSEEFPNDQRAILFENQKKGPQLIGNRSYQIKKTDFNSENSDFAPAFWGETLVFASNREKFKLSKHVHSWNNDSFLDLYQIAPKNNTVEKLDGDINTKFHESSAVFSKDGQTVYFTRNNYIENETRDDSKGINRLQLYIGVKIEKSWNIAALPFNNAEYSMAHPALSPDEKTLYFSSDMPGSFGESDIYMVNINDGHYGTPINLGKDINTESRETFPFVDSEGNLYFASDGRPGYGGLDIFIAPLNTNNNFNTPLNLGEPINGKWDDFSLILNSGKGYFASNRDNDTGDDDIYSIVTSSPVDLKTCTQTFSGNVRDFDNAEILTDVQIILKDKTLKELERINSPDGKFSFQLACDQSYTISIYKDTFESHQSSIVSALEIKNEIRSTFFLMKKKVKDSLSPIGESKLMLLGINNIYFDLGKYTLRTDAKIELDKIIAFLKRYPTLKIEVRSHTDSKASEQRNLELSNNRAKSTVDYIVAGGIDSARVSGKGLGETKLLNPCKNGVPCPEYEHFLNRRSEFIIIE